MPSLTTKRGQVSDYGLACGYIQEQEIRGVMMRLYVEHNVYRVVAKTDKLLTRKSFYKLADARHYFRNPELFGLISSASK